MRLLVAALFALLAAAVTDASPAPLELNSQRLARGLPPLRPKFRRTLPGFAKARDWPTPAFGAKRSSPSGRPTAVTYSGRIQVRNKDGHSYGFVMSNSGNIAGVNLQPDKPDNDLHVKFTVPDGQNGPVDVVITNDWFPQPLFIGAISQTAPNNFLATGSGTTASFTHVQNTSPNTPGELINGQYVQSAIWFFNPVTNELTAQYINPDGNKPTTIIAYNTRSNELFFVGDIDAWNWQHSNTPSTQVSFTLVQ